MLCNLRHNLRRDRRAGGQNHHGALCGRSVVFAVRVVADCGVVDVDSVLTEHYADVADHPRDVLVLEQHEMVVELKVEASVPQLQQVRAMAAAKSCADNAGAIIARDLRYAHELCEITRTGPTGLRNDDPPLRDDRRRVDLVDGFLGASFEQTEQHTRR